MNKAAGDFMVALVVYTMRCIDDGETDQLVRMGFGAEEIEELAALRFGDIQRMEKLPTHCLDIKVDQQAFADMIRRIRSDGRWQEWEDRLVRADAPLDMVRSLCGTNSREYNRLRQQYDVSSKSRGRVPTDEEEASLRRALAGRVEATEDGALGPGEYMAISEELGIPLRTVWRASMRVAEALS